MPIFPSHRLLWLAASFLLAGSLPGLTPLTAQTAHVNYSQSIVGYYANPKAIAADASGNYYVIDSGGSSGIYTLYKQTLSGTTYTQSTVASFPYSLSSLTVDPSGNIFVAAYNSNLAAGSIYKFAPTGSTYTQSTAVANINPLAVAVDTADNLFYSDFNSNSVVEEKLSGGSYTATTIATGFNYPESIAVDKADNVYVVDNSDRVLKETLSGNTYTQSAITSGLSGANTLAVDGAGNVFVSDTNKLDILKLSPSGSTYTSSVVVPIPYMSIGIAVDSLGAIYFPGSNSIYKDTPLEGADVPAISFPSTALTVTSGAMTASFTFDVSGTLAATPYSVVTQGDPTLDFKAAATQAANACVTGHTYAVGDSCTIAVTFTPIRPGARYGAARLLGSDGATIAVAYLQGSGSGPMVGLPVVAGTLVNSTYSLDAAQTYGFAADSSGNVYYYDNPNYIYKVRVADGAVTQMMYSSSSGLSGLALDGAGNLFIADDSSETAYFIPLGGTYDASVTVATGLSSPSGIAVDGSGNVFIADTGNSRLLKETFVDESYNQTVIGSGMSRPGGIAVDSHGNVYVADTNNSRILVETLTSGTYTQSVFPTTVSKPTSVAVDALDNLYIADDGNHRILKETYTAGAFVETIFATIPSQNDFGFIGTDQNGNVFADVEGATAGSSLVNYSVQKPPTFNYASTAVGSTSTDSPKSVAITNLGNANLIYTPNATGVNPAISAGFQLSSSSTCPQLSATSSATPLPPLATCADIISFVPVAAGSITGNVTQTDNNLGTAGATQIVASLTGSATGGGTPQATLTPSASFNSAPTGTTSLPPQTLTLTNAGTAALSITSYSVTAGTAEFAVTSTNCTASLAATSSCTYTLTFTPNATGAQTGTFSVTDSVGTQTSALTGTGLAPATLTATPNPLNFPATTVSTTASASVTLTNSGGAVLNFQTTIATLGGADLTNFTFGSACGYTLQPAASCVLTVTFTPNAIRTFNATLTIPSNDPKSPTVVILTGSGAGVLSIAPVVQAFPATAAGQSSAVQTSIITNATVQAIYLSSGSLTDATDFTQSDNCSGLIGSGKTCTVTFTFNPKAGGSFTSTYAIHDLNNPNSPLTVALSGTGTAAAQAALTPATYSFGSVVAGATAPSQTFTLTNAGNAALSITSVSLTGTNASLFTLGTNTCTTSLTAGANCTIAITFKPTVAGSYSASLTVVDAVGTQTSALTGTATAPATPADFTIAATPATQSSYRGASVNYTVQLASLVTTNPFTSAVTMSVTGLPIGATASFAPATVMPGTGASTTLTVTIPALSSQNTPAHQSQNVGIALALLCGVGLVRRNRRALRLVLLCLPLVLFASALTGCGTGTGFATPTATSTLTITGTSGTTSHATNVILTVQ